MEQYTIIERIGEGAHGIVLKAKHIEVAQCHVTVTFVIISNFIPVLLYVHFINISYIKYYQLVTIILLQSGEVVALKKVPLRKLDDGIPNTALR